MKPGPRPGEFALGQNSPGRWGGLLEEAWPRGVLFLGPCLESKPRPSQEGGEGDSEADPLTARARARLVAAQGCGGRQRRASSRTGGSRAAGARGDGARDGCARGAMFLASWIERGGPVRHRCSADGGAGARSRDRDGVGGWSQWTPRPEAAGFGAGAVGRGFSSCWRQGRSEFWAILELCPGWFL